MTKTVAASTRSVYVVGGDKSVVNMFQSMGWATRTAGMLGKESPGIAEIDLICFTGGADVSPYLYGEENVSSHCDPIRDEFEKQVYESFTRKVIGKSDHDEDIIVPGIPMVGICRGGQFLNVMNGGTMIQHIGGHSMGHREIVTTIHNGSYLVTKTHTIHEDHHQGMVIRGSGRGGLDDEPDELVGFDPRDGNSEIVWYKDTKCLCFQPHPEWGHEGTKKLFFELIEEYIGDGK